MVEKWKNGIPEHWNYGIVGYCYNIVMYIWILL